MNADLSEPWDSGPFELIKGQVVGMNPTMPIPAWYQHRLSRLLGEFVEAGNLGQMMVGGVGLFTGRNPDTIRAADVLVISSERLARATPGSFLDVAPELIAEIMSPYDRWSNIRQKLREYFTVGVQVVLIVEPDERVVSLYRSPTDVAEFRPPAGVLLDDVLPGFTLLLAALFADNPA
jgi:Uma2 family endonuclease